MAAMDTAFAASDKATLSSGTAAVVIAIDIAAAIGKSKIDSSEHPGGVALLNTSLEL